MKLIYPGKRYDLEVDLENSTYIRGKCQDPIYAQQLYAALCNIDWQYMDVLPILKEETWECSWRRAGTIVSELRDCGESYLDWYCSGMWPDGPFDEDENGILHKTSASVTPEGTVTDEIREDLKTLNWQPGNNTDLNL